MINNRADALLFPWKKTFIVQSVTQLVWLIMNQLIDFLKYIDALYKAIWILNMPM